MLARWTYPEHYAGFSPDGDIIAYAISRDADALDRANFDAAATRLCDAAKQDRLGSPDTGEPVYIWEASCSMSGWIRYLMVRADAPPAVIAEAESIASDLAACPSLDDEAWSRLEEEEADSLWASFDIRDRYRHLVEYAPECSIFAARRPYVPPNDGRLSEVLRG